MFKFGYCFKKKSWRPNGYYCYEYCVPGLQLCFVWELDFLKMIQNFKSRYDIFVFELLCQVPYQCLCLNHYFCFEDVWFISCSIMFVCYVHMAVVPFPEDVLKCQYLNEMNMCLALTNTRVVYILICGLLSVFCVHVLKQIKHLKTDIEAFIKAVVVGYWASFLFSRKFKLKDTRT